MASKRHKKRLRLPCIAPDCKELSMGPRFHYLCDTHRKARKGNIKMWKKAVTVSTKRKTVKRTHVLVNGKWTEIT